jgi:hypothetical protein
MHSPFPGMNPYLEQYWGDIHHRLITYSSDALQKQLPGDLRARVGERVFVEPEEAGRTARKQSQSGRNRSAPCGSPGADGAVREDSRRAPHSLRGVRTKGLEAA